MKYLLIFYIFLISCNEKPESKSLLFAEAIDTYFVEKRYSILVETDEIGLESRSWKIRFDSTEPKNTIPAQMLYGGVEKEFPPPPSTISYFNNLKMDKLEFREFLINSAFFDKINAKYISNHFNSSTYNYSNFNLKNVNVIHYDKLIREIGYKTYREKLFKDSLFYIANISSPFFSMDDNTIMFFLKVTNQTRWDKGCITFDPIIKFAVFMQRKNDKWIFRKQIYLA